VLDRKPNHMCGRRPGRIAALGLVSLLAGCAATTAEKAAPSERHLQRAAGELAKHSDPDSLAAAGLLSPSLPGADPFALMTRAVALAPERPDLIWLQVQACQRTVGCDPQPVEGRLRESDPSNGTGWLGAFARAFERGDAYITQMLGVAIAKRVWPEDSPQWKVAAEEQQVYEYRSKLWSVVDLWDQRHAERYLALCSQNRREQDVLLAQLIVSGKDPNPPMENH
jgi:hypothetical protein